MLLQRTVLSYPYIFEYREAEYGSSIDHFLEAAAMDSDFLTILHKLIVGPLVHRDEHDESSNTYKSFGAVLTINGATYLKTESRKDVRVMAEAATVISSMINQFASDAHKTFPSVSGLVIDVLSCREMCRLYELRLNANLQDYESTLVRSFQVDTVAGRVAFVIAIVNIARHRQTVTGPVENFHSLVPGVALTTQNKHTVRWLKDGIHKTLSVARHIDFDELLCLVHCRRLPNVEWGTVTDKRGGMQQLHVITGMKQLHALGIAHTDIKVNNVFVDSGGAVFLGDLEYIVPISESVDQVPRVATSIQRSSRRFFR